MSSPIGSAVVEVTADTSPARRELASLGDTLSGTFQNLGASISASMSNLGQTVVRAGRTGAAALGAMAATVGALTVRGGISRLLGLENANAQLRSLGLSTGQVDDLMDGLLETLRGTAFSLDEGARSMANLVASGLPLRDVDQVFRNVADAAAFARVPISEIADIFGQVQTQGRLTLQEVNRLSARGIPALRLLADAGGFSMEELSAAISAGEISAEEFFDLWEQGSQGFGEQNIAIAGSAQNMGDTTAGAFANMTTAFSRFGATLLGPVFERMRDAFSSITETVDALGERAQPLGESFAQWIDGSLIPAFERLAGFMVDEVVPALQTLIGWIQDNQDTIGEFLQVLGPAAGIVTGLATAIYVLRAAFIALISATPLGIVLLLASALVAAYQNSEQFRLVIQTLVTWIQTSLVPALQQFWTWIQINVVPALQQLWTFISTQVVPALSNLANVISTTLLPILQSLATEIIDNLRAAFDDIQRALADLNISMDDVILVVRAVATVMGANLATAILAVVVVVRLVIGTFSLAAQLFRTLVVPAINLVITVLRAMATVARTTVNIIRAQFNATGTAALTLQRLISGVVSTIIGAFDRLATGILTAILRALSVLQSVPGRVREIFANTGRWLVAAGERIIGGLISGARSRLGELRSIASEAAGIVRDLFPFSPAREGPLSGSGSPDRAGVAIVEMLAEGMRASQATLERAATAVAGTVVPTIERAATVPGTTPSPLLAPFAAIGTPRAAPATVTPVAVDARRPAGAVDRGASTVDELATALARAFPQTLRLEIGSEQVLARVVRTGEQRLNYIDREWTVTR